MFFLCVYCFTNFILVFKLKAIETRTYTWNFFLWLRQNCIAGTCSVRAFSTKRFRVFGSSSWHAKNVSVHLRFSNQNYFTANFRMSAFCWSVWDRSGSYTTTISWCKCIRICEAIERYAKDIENADFFIGSSVGSSWNLIPKIFFFNLRLIPIFYRATSWCGRDVKILLLE